MNGRPFKLAGYGWDYSGTICGMNQGKLEDLEYDPNDPAKRKLMVQLTPDYRLDETQPLTRRVQGDGIFSSDHPAMQEMNPTVTYMVVRLFKSNENL